MAKQVLFINQQAPHGTAFAQEQLQMIMVFGAFEQHVSVLFIGDGVFALVKDQHADVLGFVNFFKQYAALEKFYDVHKVYVDQQSLQQRSLITDDLIAPVSVIDVQKINELIHQQDLILKI